MLLVHALLFMIASCTFHRWRDKQLECDALMNYSPTSGGSYRIIRFYLSLWFCTIFYKQLFWFSSCNLIYLFVRLTNCSKLSILRCSWELKIVCHSPTNLCLKTLLCEWSKTWRTWFEEINIFFPTECLAGVDLIHQKANDKIATSVVRF